jgi:HAD superfamily hydrolase (TIGR01549 family)
VDPLVPRVSHSYLTVLLIADRLTGRILIKRDNSTMGIQAVFFDMGGTLETFGYTRELRLEGTQALSAYLAQAGIELPLSTEQLFNRISAGLEQYKRWSIASMEELSAFRIWSEYLLADLPIDPEKLGPIADDLMALLENRYYRRALRPEVPEVLRALQAMGLRIGLISNTNSRGLVPANLRAYGIAEFFDPVVLSSAYGRRKPDPAIFHYAARLANLPTSACAYVGDRVRRDIDGARRAGFALAIQIRHDFAHGENDEGETPDARIDDLRELIEIVRLEQLKPARPPVARAVRALLFDAGDILYFRPKQSEYFKAFLAEQGLALKPDHAQLKKGIEYKAYRGLITHDEYREAVLALYGIADPAGVARGKQALVDDDANVEFFAGVPETLLALKERGYLLGIITDSANSVSAKLSWFGRGGFGHVWDSIVSSIELGTRKPDPSIYLASLQQLGLEAGEAAFVGHRAAELDGARAVGMRTIAFNWDPGAAADCYVHKFGDLLQVLELAE